MPILKKWQRRKTMGSRSLQAGGSAIYEASQVVRKRQTTRSQPLRSKRRRHRRRRRSRSAGVPAKSISWADLATAAVEQEIGGGLAHELDFDGTDSTYPFGSHVAVVEIDRETGHVELLRHVAVDDCGTILNPMLVHGQQHGGIAQGIAQALWEHVQYDEDANPVTANLMDYLMPSAADLLTLKFPTLKPLALGTPWAQRESVNLAP